MRRPFRFVLCWVFSFVWIVTSVAVAAPIGEPEIVRLQGAARIFISDSPEGESHVLVVETRDAGQAFITKTGMYFTLESGAEIVVDAKPLGLERYELVELISVEKPSRESQDRNEDERRRRAAERAGTFNTLDPAINTLALERWSVASKVFLTSNGGVERGTRESAESVGLLMSPSPQSPPSQPLSVLILPSYCGAAPAGPSPAEFETLVNEVVSNYFTEVSRGLRSFNAVSTPWLNRCEFSAMSAERRAVIAGYEPDAYDRVVIVLAEDVLQSFLGLAEGIPGRRIYINEAHLIERTWTHEFGHVEGLTHAAALRCTNDEVDGNVVYRYGAGCFGRMTEDYFDVMGDATMGWLSTGYREQLGWSAPGELLSLTESGPYSVLVQPADGDHNGLRGVVLPLSSGRYYIEYRTGRPGIQIRVQAPALPSDAAIARFATHLLDGRPDTVGDLSDAEILWGESWVTPEGVAIGANLIPSGDAAVVKVTIPEIMPPGQPTGIDVVYDGETNEAIVTWQVPEVPWPGALQYELEAVPANGQPPVLAYPNEMGAIVDGFFDGFSGVRIRSVSPLGTSQWAGSRPWFVWAEPVGSDVWVSEGDSGETAVEMFLEFPWAVPASVTYRSLFLRPGSAESGSDYAGNLYGLPFWLLGGEALLPIPGIVYGDEEVELDETAILHIQHPYCSSGFNGLYAAPVVMDCAVWEPMLTLTIEDDDS